MTPVLQPVPDAPALLLTPRTPGAGPALVVADLHLGLGGSAATPEGPPDGSATSLAASLLDLARRTRARSVIVAGDVKHPIVGTPVPLRPVVFGFFSRLLEAGLSVEVVLGNHDVGLVPHLPREVSVHASDGTVRDGVGIFHGHRRPADRVLRAGRLVAGHLHPGVRLASTADDPLGPRRCWVRVAFSPGGNARVRGTALPTRAKELVIVPAFNPIAGIEGLNRERPARGRSFLYRRFFSAGIARAYLLDGTDLGPIMRSTRAPPAPPERARPAR